MNIKFLDGLRGIAAALVMLGHARLLLWEGYTTGYAQHPEQYSWLDKALMYWLSPFHYGHEMVMLFFILSGFVIHLRFSNRDNRLPMQVATFWKRRAVRLYPPLIFTLILAFMLDSLGKNYGWGIYNQATLYANINRDVYSVTDFSTLVGNLTFVMSVYTPPFGTALVTWSLMYEWWFYMIYPLFYVLAVRVGFKKTTAFVAFLYILASFKSIAATSLLFWRVMDSFLVWWLGVCLVELWRNNRSSTFAKFEALPYFSTFLIVAVAMKEKHIPISNGLLDLIWGLGFTGMIALLLQTQPDYWLIRLLNWFKPLGDCSYTLYLIHFPIFCFLSGWLMSQNGSLPHHSFWIIGSSVGVGFLAYALHFLIEKPFMTLNKAKKAVQNVENLQKTDLKVKNTEGVVSV